MGCGSESHIAKMRYAGFSSRPEDAMRDKLWGVWVLHDSRNPLWDFDDSLYGRTVDDQRLCCLRSAAYLGIAMDDRWDCLG